MTVERKRKHHQNQKRKAKKIKTNKNHLYLIFRPFSIKKIGMDSQIHSKSSFKNNLNFCSLELHMGREVEDF
jgi:hypothetical protein